ncbi:MAG TPA: hypothetical protein VFC78_20010, partial [Tepidisphaeraceae bacterium]|nr:hypothetical protein [Tepidisphaeraceae bacterium]
VVLSLPIWAPLHSSLDDPGRTLAALSVCLLLLDWGDRRSPVRPYRINLYNLVPAAVLALVVGLLFGANIPLTIGIVAGASLAVEMASPWSPSGAARNRRRFKPATAPPAAPPFVARGGDVNVAALNRPGVAAPPIIPSAASSSAMASGRRRIGRGVRFTWLAGFVAFTTLGLFLCSLLVAFRMDAMARAAQAGVGACSLILAAFCMSRGKMLVFPGWWRYLVRPLLVFACIVSGVMSLSFMGAGAVRGEDAIPTLFFLICPAVVLIAIYFLVPRVALARDAIVNGGDMFPNYNSVSPAAPTVAWGAGPVEQRVDGPSSPGAFATPRVAGNDHLAGGRIFPLQLAAALGRFTLGTLGFGFLAASLLVALAVAVDVPGFFNGPWIDPDLHHELRRNFGSADWPRLLRDAGAILGFMLALPALLLLLLSRQSRGTPHMLRAIVGAAGLFGAVAALGHVLPRWSQVMAGPNAAEIASQFLDAVPGPRVLGAGVLGVLAMIVLFWPARGGAKPQRIIDAAAPEANA